MKPSNDHERAIKAAVDALAAEGRLSVPSSIPEVAASLQFLMSNSDSHFLGKYVRWRMHQPRTLSGIARTASLLANPPRDSHVVFPYTSDHDLIHAASFYTVSGLSRGGAVILILTEAHCDAIRRYLKSDGNIEALEASGQLLFLDAAELLKTFIVDGYPDSKLFREGVKTVIERVQRDEHTGRNREVRILGEMVNLLWPANSAAAERLEGLGNELTEEYSIPVICAYSLNGPGRSHLPESIIKAHSHSIAL